MRSPSRIPVEIRSCARQAARDAAPTPTFCAIGPARRVPSPHHNRLPPPDPIVGAELRSRLGRTGRRRLH